MVFIFLYDQKLKSGANKKIKSFLHYVVENKLNIRFILHESALPLNPNLNYKLVHSNSRVLKLFVFLRNFQSDKIISDFVGSTLLNRKVHWLVHDIRPIYGLKGGLNSVLYKFLLRWTKNFIVVSDFTKQEILRINSKANVTLWKNGVAKRSDEKKFYRYTYDVIMVGAFVARKSHLDALDRLNEFAERYNRILKVCLVGTSGPIIKELESKIYPNIEIEVNINISDDELYEKWSLSRCTLSNSKYEGFNYTIIESLSIGRRVLLTDIEGHKHFRGVEGCFFYSDNTSFNKYLKSLLDDPSFVRFELNEFDEGHNTQLFLNSL